MYRPRGLKLINWFWNDASQSSTIDHDAASVNTSTTLDVQSTQGLLAPDGNALELSDYDEITVTPKIQLQGQTWIFDENSEGNWDDILLNREYLASGFSALWSTFLDARTTLDHEAFKHEIHRWMLAGYRATILEYLKSSNLLTERQRAVIAAMVWSRGRLNAAMSVHVTLPDGLQSTVHASTGPQAWRSKRPLQSVIKYHKTSIEYLVIELWLGKVGEIVDAPILPGIQRGPSLSTASSAPPVSGSTTTSYAFSQQPSQRSR
jgi:hypothetical protein